MKLLECVPNISEGRDGRVIEQLAGVVRGAHGVKLLNLESDFDANRSVLTFAGEADAVAEAAFQLALKCAELIDMARQTGVHPRLGALDVCPFVPLRGVTMAETVALSRAFGARAARALHAPVYLYEFSASTPERKLLATIRHGQYESLPQKLKTLPPDYGPATLNPKFGAMITGARNFLVAYNVNLKTKDVNIAKQIASVIRAYPGVKAIGWYLEHLNIVQVSCNITDFRLAPPSFVYKKIAELADVNGSQLIGLIPEEALLYGHKNADAAVKELGLGSLEPFDIKERVLEYKLLNTF